MKRLYWNYALPLLILCCLFTGCTAPDYWDAVALEERGDYEEALTLYQNFPEYKDSASRAANCETMLAHIQTFHTAVHAVQEKNAAFEQVLAEANALLTDPIPLLDKSLYAELEIALKQSTAMIAVPTVVPKDPQQLLQETDYLTETDYSPILTNINGCISTILQNNLQYELVNMPSETYVIVKLKSLPTILDTAAVTEATDPEGTIHKDHGYVSAVYFSTNLIADPLETSPDLPEQQHQETIPNGLKEMEWLEPMQLPTQEPLSVSQLEGLELIEEGVKAGGCIETFRTPEDARLREEYLATFDGTTYDQGSHTIVGTVLIRTSNLLTPEQQQDLEYSIISALTALPY